MNSTDKKKKAVADKKTADFLAIAEGQNRSFAKEQERYRSWMKPIPKGA